MGLRQSKGNDQAAAGGQGEDQKLGGGLLLGDLSRDCLVCILSCLQPRDVCRVALVSRSFLEASSADAVWEQMLPPCYQDIVAQSHPCPLQFNRGACYLLSARALSIVWGSDPRYWEWHHRHGSRFQEVAYLSTVCWFEVSGCLNTRMPPGTYTVSFRIKLMGEQQVVSHAHGWGNIPVSFLLTTADGQQTQSQRYLHGVQVTGRRQLESSNFPSVRMVDDYWMEYDVGQFIVMSGDELVDVRFSMKEIGGHWKSGLFLDGAVICPSYLVPHQAPGDAFHERIRRLLFLH